MNEQLLDNVMILCAYTYFTSQNDLQIAYERALERIVEYEHEIHISDLNYICRNNVYEHHIRHIVLTILTSKQDLEEVVRVRESNIYHSIIRQYNEHLMKGVGRYRSA